MEFAELLDDILADVRRRKPDAPALIGVGGSQGSGKSYQCRAFAHAHPRVVHFSLDDVYLNGAERRKLAQTQHKLFATRGPPGTHDLDLALRTIQRLNRAAPDEAIAIPRFDKARDERMAPLLWPRFVGRPDALLIDGWCLGALPFEGAEPPNALEAEADPDGRWRRLMFAGLAERYRTFFSAFDEIVYLQAPSFEIVRRWRGEQEEDMLGRAMNASESAALDRFVEHYERVTRAMLAGHHSARWIVHLDDQRTIERIEERQT